MNKLQKQIHNNLFKLSDYKNSLSIFTYKIDYKIYEYIKKELLLCIFLKTPFIDGENL